MDAEYIIGSLIEGALTGRRGRRRALGRLTGGSGSLINASTLMTAAGLAWGLYEAATSGKASASTGAAPGNAPTSPLPPPLPGETTAKANDTPAELLRLVRLTVSAARADGDLSLEERGRILAKAREVGLEDVVAAELQASRPLAEIVAGVNEPQLKEELYRLAYGVARSDEGVTGAERIYLAQLAHHLGLDPAGTARIERDAESSPPARGGPAAAE